MYRDAEANAAADNAAAGVDAVVAAAKGSNVFDVAARWEKRREPGRGLPRESASWNSSSEAEDCPEASEIDAAVALELLLEDAVETPKRRGEKRKLNPGCDGGRKEKNSGEEFCLERSWKREEMKERADERGDGGDDAEGFLEMNDEVVDGGEGEHRLARVCRWRREWRRRR